MVSKFNMFASFTTWEVKVGVARVEDDENGENSAVWEADGNVIGRDFGEMKMRLALNETRLFRVRIALAFYELLHAFSDFVEPQWARRF